MAKQVDTNCSASNGLAPLHLAAIANHLETAAALIEGKADPNQQTAQGFSALMIAAFLGIEEFVKLLLEKVPIRN